MYPIIRMTKELLVHAKAPPLPLTGMHRSWHMCWPWDLDLWMELNNGRTLTLFDLGRIPLVRRIGLVKALRENGWGLTVAGLSARYRRRIRLFHRVEMRSRVVGWDERFFYVEQSMWKDEASCTTHVLVRLAVTGPGGIVAPGQVLAAMGQEGAQAALPGWVRAWTEAEAKRPWPPEM